MKGVKDVVWSEIVETIGRKNLRTMLPVSFLVKSNLAVFPDCQSKMLEEYVNHYLQLIQK